MKHRGPLVCSRDAHHPTRKGRPNGRAAICLHHAEAVEDLSWRQAGAERGRLLRLSDDDDAIAGVEFGPVAIAGPNVRIQFLAEREADAIAK